MGTVARIPKVPLPSVSPGTSSVSNRKASDIVLVVDADSIKMIYPYFSSFRDAKCGKIQCQGGANRPVIGTNAVSIETNIPLQEGGKILCRGTHVYLGDDMPDPGLVLAGTKCEDGKVRFRNSLP